MRAPVKQDGDVTCFLTNSDQGLSSKLNGNIIPRCGELTGVAQVKPAVRKESFLLREKKRLIKVGGFMDFAAAKKVVEVHGLTHKANLRTLPLALETQG